MDWEGTLPIEGKVIVIEDDPTLRSLMTDILSEIGAKSLAFESCRRRVDVLFAKHLPLPACDRGLGATRADPGDGVYLDDPESSALDRLHSHVRLFDRSKRLTAPYDLSAQALVPG